MINSTQTYNSFKNKLQGNKKQTQNVYIQKSSYFMDWIGQFQVLKPKNQKKKWKSFYQQNQIQVEQSIFLKPNQSSKINVITIKNYQIIISQIINDIKKQFPTSKHLLKNIEHSFSQISFVQKQNLIKILTIRDMKRQLSLTWDSLQEIYDQIKILILSNQSIFKKILTEVCSDYFLQKYTDKYKDNTDYLKKQLGNDLLCLMKLFSKIIYWIFKPWFNLHQKSYNIQKIMLNQFMPGLITLGKRWKKIYSKILDLLGRSKLNMQQKQIQKIFEQSVHLKHIQVDDFKQTIGLIKQMYSQQGIDEKIKTIQKLWKVFKCEVQGYFNRVYGNNLRRMQIDDELRILQYCIIRSQKNGIYQSLQYLQLFFKDESKYKMNYLYKINIAHLITTLKISALKLKDKPQTLINNTLSYTQSLLKNYQQLQ